MQNFALKLISYLWGISATIAILSSPAVAKYDFTFDPSIHIQTSDGIPLEGVAFHTEIMIEVFKSPGGFDHKPRWMVTSIDTIDLTTDSNGRIDSPPRRYISNARLTRPSQYGPTFGLDYTYNVKLEDGSEDGQLCTVFDSYILYVRNIAFKDGLLDISEEQLKHLVEDRTNICRKWKFIYGWSTSNPPDDVDALCGSLADPNKCYSETSGWFGRP